MKLLTTVLGLALAIFIGGSLLLNGAITGSKHDFKSGYSWNTTTEICIVCHTPHNASTSVSGAPLWNHAVTSQTFTVYSSAWLHATAGQPTSSNSKLCLSCHDGVTALDAFGGAAGTSPLSSPASAVMGTNLGNDHPISLNYLGTTAGLKDSSTTVTALSGSINSKMLIGGKVECSSCHDVHNGSGNTHMLLVSNSQSALCLTCHNK